MMMTRMGSMLSADTFKTLNPPKRDVTPPVDYDFGLPPGLQLVPQAIKFIEPDGESDTDANDQFVKRHQPETPQAQTANNPFTPRATTRTKLRSSRLLKAPSVESLDDYQHLEQIKKEIKPLLRDHKKGTPYPEKIIQLTKQAAKENPELKTKHLAEILGIPFAIVYYWLGYQSPKHRNKKPTNPNL